jgi:phage head maturation protease
MPKLEFKATERLELSELSTEKRTAVIAHAHYDNLDRKRDISRKGMFSKSWREVKASEIKFLIDHDKTQQPGRVISVFDDEKKAYTKVKFSESTLGNDTLIMMDEGIIQGASFGFYAIKANPIKVGGKPARELREVLHDETTVTLGLDPVNPLAGVEKVTKALLPEPELNIELKALSQSEFDILRRLNETDQSALQMLVELSGNVDKNSDLYEWVLWQLSRRADSMGSIRGQIKYNSGELKAIREHIDRMEKFCRNTTASDDCIQSVEAEIKAAKSVLDLHDTANTRLISEPSASVNKEFSNALHLLTLKSF